MNLLPWSALLAVSTSSVYFAQRCRQAALTIRRLVSEHIDLRQELAGQHAVSGAAELRYKLLFNDVSAPIIITRYSGDIVTANAAFVRMLGYESEAELRTHNAAEFYVDPGVREAEMRHLSMEPHNHNREFPLKRKDGSLIKVVVTGRVLPLENGNEPLIEGIFTDITALRLVEERCGQLEHGLRTSQKLRSIGSLAAGVAHEINTPLQYISDSVHVLMTRVHELLEIARTEDSLTRAARVGRLEEQIARALERTVGGIGSVTRIVRAMKEFSHPGKAGSAPADLNQALRTTLTVSRNEYRHIADVETDLQELPPVWCQLGDLNQVFLNLIVNAAHAIEEAGRGKGMIRIVSRVAHGAVTISIGDNGSGMPDSIRDRIFDPFFTTKPIGKGTGQGLAIVRTVVEQHAGEIHVDSLPGRGTTFTIQIPVDARGLERAIVNERIVSHG